MASLPGPLVPVASLTVVRLQAVFRAAREVAFSGYAGTALRGVFGWALARQACDCGLLDRGEAIEAHDRTCLFRQLFRPTVGRPIRDALEIGGTAPAPYVLRPPLSGRRVYGPGDLMQAEVLLMGRAGGGWLRVVAALDDLAVGGPGDRGLPLTLVGVWDGAGRAVWEPGRGPVTGPASQPVIRSGGPVRGVRFLTPIALRRARSGSDVRAGGLGTLGGLRLLAESGYDRLARLAALYAPGVEGWRPPRGHAWLPSFSARVAADLYDVTRTQRPEWDSGVAGALELGGLPEEVQTVLRALGGVHAGRKTARGMGWLVVQ